MENQIPQSDPTQPIQPPQSPPLPQMPPPPPVKDTPLHTPGLVKKLIVVIGIILVFAAIGAGGYFLGVSKNKTAEVSTSQITPTATPTPSPSKASATVGIPDQTANWKTYTKDKLTFKYPPISIFGEYSSSNSGRSTTHADFIFSKTEQGCYPHQYPGVALSITKVNPNQTLQQALKEVGGQAPSGDEDYLYPAIIGGLSGLRGTTPFSATAINESAYVLNDNNLYFFNLCTDDELLPLHKKYYELMLATFKFTQ